MQFSIYHPDGTVETVTMTVAEYKELFSLEPTGEAKRNSNFHKIIKWIGEEVVKNLVTELWKSL